MKIVISGRLGGFNEYIRACRTNAHAGAEFKKENEEIALAYIRQQARGIRFKRSVSIDIAWYEKDNRRDPDNISGFGHKVILDALVRGGVIVDDSRRYVKTLKDSYHTDRKNPRIEITITESGE